MRIKIFFITAAVLIFVLKNVAIADEQPNGFKTVKVKPGDTLQKISMEAYGTTLRWKEIFETNRAKLSKHNMIEVGMELKMSTAGMGTKMQLAKAPSNSAAPLSPKPVFLTSKKQGTLKAIVPEESAPQVKVEAPTKRQKREIANETAGDEPSPHGLRPFSELEI